MRQARTVSDGQVWRLLRRGEPLGEIVVDDGDFPWLHGRFVPEPAFSEVRPLFERSLELLDAEDYAAWEPAYDRINATMTLVAPDGPVAEFLLHIQADRAWFRWSDEPFADET
jgi:hypothetical protein